jgi:hypothetical protein
MIKEASGSIRKRTSPRVEAQKNRAVAKIDTSLRPAGGGEESDRGVERGLDVWLRLSIAEPSDRVIDLQTSRLVAGGCHQASMGLLFNRPELRVQCTSSTSRSWTTQIRFRTAAAARVFLDQSESVSEDS